MGTQTQFDVCAGCGIVRKLHGTGLAGCGRFTAAHSAQEASAATEAARQAGADQERTYAALRRAVASWHLSEARELIDQLQAQHG